MDLWKLSKFLLFEIAGCDNKILTFVSTPILVHVFFITFYERKHCFNTDSK